MGIGNTSQIIRSEDYRKGFEEGYRTALRELQAWAGEANQPGRVPEDAIEHRNGPKFKDTIETKGQ